MLLFYRVQHLSFRLDIIFIGINLIKFPDAFPYSN